MPTESHPTIQSAVDDPSCNELEIGSQVYIESVTVGRTLEIMGVSTAATTVAGRVGVTGTSKW